jgi:cubilin
VHDGNLVFESADSRNVSIYLKGQSRFLINNVDVLNILKPGNASNTFNGGDDSDAITKLTAQVAKLRQMMRGQNGVMNRLDRVERGIPANATIPAGSLSDRSRFNGLQRRVVNLELKVANLTERLMRDHCKSYPCQNGGTCFNMFETYRCECPANWEGPSCSVDVNECARYAGTDLGCQNGATCINNPGSYE